MAYHIFHKQISNKEIESYFDNFDANNPEYLRIYQWIYYSLINGVFKSKGAGWIPYKTGIRKILNTISLYKNREFPVSAIFDVYQQHGVNFTSMFDSSNLEKLENTFLYYLIYDREQVIRIQDIDHIHPKSRLESKYDWTKINSIANFQLLDSGTNRGEKNAKPFEEWFNSCVSDKDAFLLRHLIPADKKLWNEDKFEDFLKAKNTINT